MLDSSAERLRRGRAAERGTVPTADPPTTVHAPAGRDHREHRRRRPYCTGHPLYEPTFVRADRRAGRGSSRQPESIAFHGSSWRGPAIRRMSISCCAASTRRSICWPPPNCRSRKSPTRPATTARRISFTASARTLALHPESFGSIRSNRWTSVKTLIK